MESAHSNFQKSWIERAEEFQAIQILLDILPETVEAMELRQEVVIYLESQTVPEELGSERAVLLLERGTQIVPKEHKELVAIYGVLGKTYVTRYEAAGNSDDFHKAVQCAEQMDILIPDGHPLKLIALNNAGNLCRMRFKLLGKLEDIDKAIEYLAKVVLLVPDSHLVKLDLRNRLRNLYINRFERLGSPGDISKAIEYDTQALLTRPIAHAHKPLLLGNLGSSHMGRSNCLGRLEDINLAVQYLTEAIFSTPAGHTSRPGWLSNLGSSLRMRFEHLGIPGDIDKAIEFQTLAVSLTADSDTHKLRYLNNLGVLHTSRFECLGELKDLNQAVQCHEKIMSLAPGVHAEQPALLNNLGLLHAWRFGRLGNIEDINKAIEYETHAVLHTPNGLGDKLILSNLGGSYMARFARLGELEDIDKAVEYQTKAVLLAPDGHMAKPALLNNLGSSYARRFERLGELRDIDRAIHYQKQAVSLTPDDNAYNLQYLGNLGVSHTSRFEHLSEVEDIDLAIKHLTQVVILVPDGRAGKPYWLDALGNSHRSRYKCLGKLEDIEKAIEHMVQAMSLIPKDRTDNPALLSNLGNLQMERFCHLGKLEDINKAIGNLTQALSLLPDGHSNRPILLNNLGDSYKSRFWYLKEPADIQQCIAYLIQSAHSPTGHPLFKLKASLLWARLSVQHALPSSLDAYGQAISLVPQVIWLGTTVSRRYELIKSDIEGLAVEAACIAISCQAYNKALEWLEAGRSIVWNQLLQLRTPIEELVSADAQLAEKFEKVSLELNHSSSLRAEAPTISGYTPSLDEAADQHRNLANIWKNLVCEIRSREGFHNFFCPRSMSELLTSSRAGAVVVIITHNRSCDALILLPRQTSVSHVPLCSFTLKKAIAAQNQLKSSLQSQGLINRGVSTQSNPHEILGKVLTMLWNDVAKPVVDFLGYSDIPLDGHLPRITWCATGPLVFLPIHAAGDYTNQRSILPNLVVSSYTPTLSTLLAPPQAHDEFLGVLGVNQTSTLGFPPIPGTADELDRIQRCTVNLPFTRLDDRHATCHAVLAGMEKHSWAHIACHASQNNADPTRSAFHLADGALDLAAITRRPLKDAQFAFLSACQTATGDETLSNESIHLAAGMLMAGFPSVVATMWSIHDTDAPLVAEKVYARMLEGGVPDTRRAAYALHEAVKCLRAKVGDKAFTRWVPYIHLGH